MKTQINGQLWSSFSKSNPKLCCLQNVELQGFLFLFPSLSLANGGLDDEFRGREMKKWQGFPWRSEGEEENVERERYSRFWAKQGANPYINY